jgi:glycosyltransferase involved in cell wall biosynthesis
MVSHWFDFDLMEGLADAGFEISLIGYTDSRHHLFSHPNVRYTPVVSQQKLPELLKSTDALLIPYKVNEFTEGVFPTKAYECLATGKPVVATPLPDLQDRFSGHIYLASDTTEFTKVLRQLPRLENRKKVKSRLELARKNTWEIRLRSIYREVEQLLHA